MVTDITRKLASVSSNTVATTTDTEAMVYTLYINLLLFVILMVFFEMNRYMKQVYLKRMKKRFEVTEKTFV